MDTKELITHVAANFSRIYLGGIPSLLKMKQLALNQGFHEKWVRSWESVNQEVNRFKHQNLKFVDGPVLTYEEAIQSLDHLVEALQWATRR